MYAASKIVLKNREITLILKAETSFATETRLAKCEGEQAGAKKHEAAHSHREESSGHEVIITHGTPSAPDTGPNLLKISESAFW